ncbi:sodium:proton antiporter [Geomonas sp. RF6]|uniref:cation:proton antiporter n=1 Tax=Geomonas sp. RF6 TaxID=2897342 RepID=UPI001E5209DD|nr:sodium:proton antiporter [Geomonas sp. RF6]UFS72136.1 sodium:proton antiporter [Geomonas sp. RF6]
MPPAASSRRCRAVSEMRIFQIIGILTSLSAAFAYLNHRLLRLPTTIGLMLQSLVLSLILMALLALGVDIARPAQAVLSRIDFDVLLLEGLLSFLLFAGSLFVQMDQLLDVKFDIALFSVVGVLISSALIGGVLLWGSILLGLGVRPLYAFLFGALISPTDPVAVLPTLRRLGVPKRTDAQIAGEALFNDGVGIVLFLSLLSLARGSGELDAADALLLFLRSGCGGVLFGTILGWAGYFIMKSVDDYQLEILVTLALVSGGYSLALSVGVSGPLAMVMAGLLIGGRGRERAMSPRTRENLDRFWELVEEMLNSILFTLIGLEVLVISGALTSVHLVTALLAIPVVLLARYLSVLAVGALLRLRTPFSWGSAWIMTWGGLRGGISIALALSLPPVPERSVLLFATYVVVVFSILVQGSTLRRLVPKKHPRP